MRSQDDHVSDQDLLLLSDGELRPGRSAEVRQHLEACWKCRTRVREIEETIADVVHVQRAELDCEVPPIDGSRALLKARLAEAAVVAQKAAWPERFLSVRWGRVGAFAGVVIVVVTSLIIWNRSAVSAKAGSIPNSTLTPGAIRPVTQREICSAGYRDMNRTVPFSVQQAVFKKYGIQGARTKDFEVDYLITPELGGADDMQNLWPEPYASTDWGAHVKDALEDRLHHMVCEGKVDLTTAQRDLSGDWISAYKKYFHTDKPIFIESSKPEKSSGEIEGHQST